MLHSTVPTQKQTHSLEQLRTRFIVALAIAGIVISMSGLLVQLVAGNRSFIGVAYTTLLAGACGFVLEMVRRKENEIGANALIFLFAFAFFFVPRSDVLFLLGTMTLMTGALLGRNWIYGAANLVVFGRYALLLITIIAENGLTPTDEGTSLITQASALVVVSVITRFFIATTEATARQAQRSADLLQATSEVAQITSQLLDRGELFKQATDLIRDRFGFYHVQIFMLDSERRYAVLVASTGNVGQQLLNKGHRLAVGSQSVIGRVTQLGELVVARDADTGTVHARNELLPSTRSELALPLLDGDQIIGALDVQSTQRDAFDAIDIQALTVMANQVSTAIRNARLFEEQNISVQENKRLFFEAETSLREIERLNRQLTRHAWQDYLGEKSSSVGVQVRKDGTLTDVQWSSSMIEASRRLRPVRAEDEQAVAVPIVLRGEVIGAIEVETGKKSGNEETIEMVQSVAQRLAISLDNARLFEEAQQATLQEQRLNEIVGRYQSAATVDELLQITLQELSHSLGAKGGMIRLGLVQNGHSQNGGSST